MSKAIHMNTYFFQCGDIHSPKPNRTNNLKMWNTQRDSMRFSLMIGFRLACTFVIPISSHFCSFASLLSYRHSDISIKRFFRSFYISNVCCSISYTMQRMKLSLRQKRRIKTWWTKSWFVCERNRTFISYLMFK